MNRYEAYRDSGIDWIGEIPEHWEVKKIKHLASYNDDSLAENTDPDYQFHYIEIGDVDYIDGLSIKNKISFNESPSRARRIVKPNDVIISTVRTYLRAIGVVPGIENIICSTGFCVLRGNPDEIDQNFLSFSVRSEWFISDVIRNSYGVSYPAINSSELVELKVALPPLQEQNRIARYLDKKTEQINSLIKKLQKKIELLKEQRAARISQAVTKGLDPDVEMKDSGVEWIGEIPKHWKISKIGRHFKLQRGRIISHEEIYDNPGPYPVYSSQTKKNGELGSINTYDFEGEYVSWTTDGANAGTCFYRNGKFNVTNVCGLLSPWEPETNLKFLSYFLNLGTRAYVRWDINPKLMNDMMSEIPLLLVPGSEQNRIACYLDKKTGQTDSLVEMLSRKIELLKEYRQALISSVVTGKVRVTEDMI